MVANCPDFGRERSALSDTAARRLCQFVLFAIAVPSLVLVVENIFRKLLSLLVNHDVQMEYLITFIAYVLPFWLIFTIPLGIVNSDPARVRATN